MVLIPQTIEDKTRAALAGDSAALGDLFEWYRPRLLSHAMRICGNTPLARDAVQETFISAFLHYNSLRDTNAFYPWLKKILRNHCLRLLSKNKNHEPIESKDLMIHHSIQEKLERTANVQWVHDAMSKLSDELKSCVLLRYFSNYNSYEEIAQVLAIPIGTVRSRLSAAKEKMLQCHNRYEDAGDKALIESKKWASYYSHLWQNLYEDTQVRKELLNNFHPLMNIRFTSGKTAKGRDILETVVNEDLQFGSKFNLLEVTGSGNICVIEGTNINSKEYPDRCPISSVFVCFRGEKLIETFHVFDSPRPKL